MGGPIMMAEVTAKVAELGIEPMLRWIAFISANIGFLNLLPIPVLDGGHLMFYAVRSHPAESRRANAFSRWASRSVWRC